MKKIKILAIICALAMATNVHAALQSRPGVDAKNASVSDFFKLIREMEATGGVMGLNANFARNSTTGEYEETTETNSVDVHMCKNTEWGAAAMLASSDYGAGNNNITNTYDKTNKTYGVTASTTGDMTGVFGMYGGSAFEEYVAGAIISKMNSSDSYCGYLTKAAPRYMDSYMEGTSYQDLSRYIPGDATYEMKTFRGGTSVFIYNTDPIFVRGGSGMLASSSENGKPYPASYYIWGARACMWVGDGI